MGNQEYPILGKREPDLRTCTDVVVVASASHSGELSRIIATGSFPGLKVVELDAAKAIPQSVVDHASLVVVEVDPASPASIERLSAFARSHEDLPVIAAIPEASVALTRTLVREGVTDVIALPFDADELLDVALNVLAVRSSKASAQAGLAPMIAVVRSIGGCGATSIATHLTAALGERGIRPGEAVVVDLDMQFGSVADVLSADGRGTIADLLDAGERLDDDLVRSVVRQTDDGISVIAAPSEITPLETIDTDQLLRVLEVLRKHFSYVVLDLPANWTNWTLSAAVSSNVVLLVVELSVTSLRQARRRLELFRSVGIPADHVAIVVNRVERRLFKAIGLDDVENTLHRPALASIALDEPTVSAAQDQGRLVTSLHRKSRFGSDIGRLADALRTGALGERE